MGRRWPGDALHPPLRGWPAAPGLLFHSQCSYPGEEEEQQSIQPPSSSHSPHPAALQRGWSCKACEKPALMEPNPTRDVSHQGRAARGPLTSRMYVSRVGSCLIFVQRMAANCTSSFSVLEPRRWPLSWSSFCQGRERDAGVLAALPLCAGASAAPPLWASVPGTIWQVPPSPRSQVRGSPAPACAR